LVVLALCEVNRTGMDIKDPVWIPEPFNIRGSHQLNHDFGDALLLARVRRSEALLVRDGKGRYRDEVGDIFLRFDGAGQTVTDGMHMEQVWEADAARLRAEYGFKGKGGRIDRSTPDTSTEGF
jgi:hypothetical protein